MTEPKQFCILTVYSLKEYFLPLELIVIIYILSFSCILSIALSYYFVPPPSAPWALAGGGAARCVSADGAFAVTLRCAPLKAHLARTIDETHPNVVMAAVGAAAASVATAAALEPSAMLSADTATADPMNSHSNRQQSLTALLSAGAAEAVVAGASSGHSSSGAKLVGVGPRGVGPNMLVLRGPSPPQGQQQQQDQEEQQQEEREEEDEHTLGVVRVHPSSAALCRFAACDPRARRSVLAAPLKAIAKAQLNLSNNTAAAAASGSNSSCGSGNLAASQAVDEEWALGYSSLNSDGTGEGGGGDSSDLYNRSGAPNFSAAAPPCTFATLSPGAATAVWRRMSQHVASGFQVRFESSNCEYGKKTLLLPSSIIFLRHLSPLH